MSDFQFILREWIKTSGFLTHELVKRFFLLYPLLCISSDCYLQVQVAFQAWFETIEHPAAASESQVPVPTPSIAPEISDSSTEGLGTQVSIGNQERPMIAVEPDTNAEEAINVEDIVRNILAEEMRPEGSNTEESLE